MSKFIIKKKAYSADISAYSENWYIDNVFHGETVGQAKLDALNVLRDYERFDGEDTKFINVSLRRHKSHDLIEYKGKDYLKFELERLLELEQRDAKYQEILDKNPNAFAMIRKRGTYYEDDYNGYTEYYHLAGVYPLKDAFSHVKGYDSDGLCLRIIDNITEHNEKINKLIKRLETHLLPV